MKTILVIAHFFPPTGGAGVQRSSKFVKYLPTYGYLPVVVTGARDPTDRWSPEDLTLLSDIPDNVVVYRAKWEKGKAPRSGKHSPRQEALYECAVVAVEKHRPDLIFVSMSPFQDASVASALSARFDIPWVADLRDPWALDEFQVYQTRFHRYMHLRRMKRALITASGIIMNTPVAKRRLIEVFPEFRRRPVISITNGFDTEDVSITHTKEHGECFKIVHTGTFHTQIGLHQRAHDELYRILGKCSSGVKLLPRSPFFLLQALDRIYDRDPDIMKNIQVIFAGTMSEEDTRLISDSKIAGRVVVTGYLDHVRSASHVCSADLLFLPLHGLNKSDRSSIVPGKAYEYIASGNPILAALPAGDARDFIEESGNCWLADPGDVSALEMGIRHFYGQWIDGSICYKRDASRLRKFERKQLTKDLAEFLGEI